jgi:modulator of FtsH protease HflK
VVQARRTDPVNYSVKLVDPEATVQDVTESALREVIGTSELETLVTGERDQIAQRTLETLQATLDQYESGINITSVSIINLDYPQDVQAAVNDTQKATNDSARFRLEAEKYARDIIPRARGDAQRIILDAKAYQDRVERDAEGEASRFVALLAEYQKAPRVTRDRLYIDAVEEVYASTNKVLLDTDGSGNLLYIPIDKLIEGASQRQSVQEIDRLTEQSRTTSPERRIELENRDRRTRQ